MILNKFRLMLRPLNILLLLSTLGVSSTVQAGTVFVHLFEWKWTDIATECETYLGPKGFDAVQISPPYEHITGDTWWTRYQPVSYQLVSRSGNRDELIDMVQRCKLAGVKIYADAVINHTAALNGSGTGTAGTNWSYKNHPMFSHQNYHNTCLINDYGDTGNVQNCELSNLPDLDTSSSYVQEQLANYLNDLTSIGISGFRIDAAKHMSPSDLREIYNRLNDTPYIFQEVIGASGEAVQPSQYVNMADVTEMKYSQDLKSNFDGQIKNLKTLGPSWNLLESNDAVVFIDNHDTQRGHGGGGDVLTFKSGATYDLANIFMLAWPYGYPKIMSSYDFNNSDQGPPDSNVHNGNDLNCFASEWKCEHRWQGIGNMVAFRNATRGNWFTTDWWDNNNNQIAFGRGDKGFVVINNESADINRTFNTSLAQGQYCNIATGDFENGLCNGDILSVNSDGTVHINVAAYKAAAIHIDAKVSDDEPSSNTWYFRGTSNNWTATPLTSLSDTEFEICQSFTDPNARFKIDRMGDWSESYPDVDYVVSPHTNHIIKFNSVTKSIKITLVDSCSDTATPTDPNTDFVTIHYKRSDNNYTDWGLHLWGDGLVSSELTSWNAPKVFDKSDNWGKFTQVAINNFDLGLNFIIHNGNNKDTDLDRSFIPRNDSHIWIQSNDSVIYTNQPDANTPEPPSGGDKLLIHGMELGAKYSEESTKFSIWSPDTSNVLLWLDGQTHTMTRQPDDLTYQNVYSVTINGDQHLKEYNFKINGNTVRDPYGVMVKPNTDNNIVMDLSRTKLSNGWATRPVLKEREDAIIYETHVRDFTIDASSGVHSNKRGRFMGMVERGTNLNGMKTGIDHLVEMGITHVQLMPVYDFASCPDLNDLSCYNWGYDPQNFNIPEERYSISQDYEERIREFKVMVNEFHKAGIRVVIDVVYNHTYVKEMFDKISSHYYTPTDLSGTGNSIDANVPMVGQMILDSLDYWVREYNIDGFRFDLIGIFDYDEVGHWVSTINARYPDRNLLVYGEPWNGYANDPRESERVRLGTIARIEDAHIGVFNPKFREAIKGQNDQAAGGGFAFNQGKAWEMRMGSRGAIRHTNTAHTNIDTWDPMFATDPEQSINYVSAHDNLVLRDKILLWADANGVERDSDYLRRIQRFANGIVLTSQGIPFIHSGAEFMRDKQGHHNSYDAGDSFNKIRWHWKADNMDIVNYYKKVISMRKNHAGFRLNTWNEINNNVITQEISDSFIVNKINGAANGDNWRKIIVIYNSGNNIDYQLPDGEWKVALEKSDANLSNDRIVYGSITSEGTSVTVLYQQ
ncbi:type I pullulanase [Pseudoalteromonas denitrificans]|uniref:pullulanase n=1 Tax=Pseudoalteromonas denitrificans DSM 6059 TaxID=1123010 RepID=A0A1I1QDA7_9GAMM|nr:type I pullulanase [Pseudoalteromonas denitrificans]SFD20025.1 pullulanase, type I [Pseudoalteromonas denitrificans DSM 6059]